MLDERFGLADRVVVVAGAGGGGIGTAVCRLLAEAGAAVGAIDVDPARLALTEEAMDATGGRYLPLVADVRREEEVERCVEQTVDRLGPLHGLVHVAGGLRIDQWARLADLPMATFDEVLDLNLRAAFVTSRVAARRLEAQGGGGSIVHLASIAGLTAMPYGAPYGMAKAGMMALVRTAAVEWGRLAIRVNAVAAGTVRTPKTDGASPGEDTPAERAAVPLGRRGRPDDIAGAVLFLLSDLAAWISGQVLAVDGGSSARPSFLDHDDLPVFVHDRALRDRLLGER